MGAFSKWYVMNYGTMYEVVKFNETALNDIKRAISSQELEWEEGLLEGDKKSQTRKSDIAWIKDQNLVNNFLQTAQGVNRKARWNLNITHIEPIQFGSYPAGGFYDWHLDQHAQVSFNLVRKISMSLFLNDDFEGGEFDLEIYKPGTECRYETFKLPAGSALFFESYRYHRVRPVTKGIRKSLVAWFNGPPYV